METESINWVHCGNENFRNLKRNHRGGFTDRIQEMEERISGTEDSIEETDTLVKENTKPKNKTKEKNLLKQNIQEIWNTMKRPNVRVIGVENKKKKPSSKAWKIFSVK